MRFSKSAVITELCERANVLQEKHGFSTDTGSKQVEGKSNELIVAYTKWRLYLDLLRDIESGEFP